MVKFVIVIREQIHKSTILYFPHSCEIVSSDERHDVAVYVARLVREEVAVFYNITFGRRIVTIRLVLSTDENFRSLIKFSEDCAGHIVLCGGGCDFRPRLAVIGGHLHLQRVKILVYGIGRLAEIDRSDILGSLNSEVLVVLLVKVRVQRDAHDVLEDGEFSARVKSVRLTAGRHLAVLAEPRDLPASVGRERSRLRVVDDIRLALLPRRGGAEQRAVVFDQGEKGVLLPLLPFALVMVFGRSVRSYHCCIV